MKIETVEITGGPSGRMIINRGDFDPTSQDLYDEPGAGEGEGDKGSPVGVPGVSDVPAAHFPMSRGEAGSLTYAELKPLALGFGVKANGKGALIERLAELKMVV